MCKYNCVGESEAVLGALCQQFSCQTLKPKHFIKIHHSDHFRFLYNCKGHLEKSFLHRFIVILLYIPVSSEEILAIFVHPCSDFWCSFTGRHYRLHYFPSAFYKLTSLESYDPTNSSCRNVGFTIRTCRIVLSSAFFCRFYTGGL